MTVSVLGCGWYGRALAAALLAKGIVVKGSATNKDKLSELSHVGIQPYIINFPDNDKANDPNFFDSEVLVVSIPPKFRKGEGDGLMAKMRAIISAIESHQIKQVIYTSSTAVYSDAQGTVTEDNEPIPGDVSGKLLLEAENFFQDQAEFKSTIIRFGGLIGPGRHPGRFFAGKKDIPNGLAPVNLIHLDDCVGITIAIIEQSAYGNVFNACFPDHPAKADFYRAASLQAGLELPEFISETNSLKTVDSVKLKQLLGYQFKYDNWADCNFE